MEDVGKASAESNLGTVISNIKEIVSRFQAQPLLHVDKDNAQILRKYPKYLTRYSLLHLQFQDYLFRETFLVQVLIFTQALLTPVTAIQKKLFAAGLSDNEKKLLQLLQEKVMSMLMQESGATSQQGNDAAGKRRLEAPHQK